MAGVCRSEIQGVMVQNFVRDSTGLPSAKRTGAPPTGTGKDSCPAKGPILEVPK